MCARTMGNRRAPAATLQQRDVRRSRGGFVNNHRSRELIGAGSEWFWPSDGVVSLFEKDNTAVRRRRQRRRRQESFIFIIISIGGKMSRLGELTKHDKNVS